MRYPPRASIDMTTIIASARNQPRSAKVRLLVRDTLQVIASSFPFAGRHYTIRKGKAKCFAPLLFHAQGPGCVALRSQVQEAARWVPVLRPSRLLFLLV